MIQQLELISQWSLTFVASVYAKKLIYIIAPKVYVLSTQTSSDSSLRRMRVK